VQHATVNGLLIGLLLGFVMTLLRDMALSDGLLRIAVLAGFGALMPALLAWLDGLLRPEIQQPICNRKEIQS
jgi:small basic protein